MILLHFKVRSDHAFLHNDLFEIVAQVWIQDGTRVVGQSELPLLDIVFFLLFLLFLHLAGRG